MKIPTYLAVSYLSFFSKDLYKFIASKWQNSYGFKYAAYLALILGFFSTIATIIFFAGIDVNKPQEARQKEFSIYLSNIINQIPDFSISKGHLVLEEEKQYVIKDPESNRNLFILDNSKSPKIIVDKNTIATITTNELTIYNYSNTPKRHPLSKIFPESYSHDITIEKEKIILFLQKVKIKLYFFIILVYLPFMTVVSFTSLIIKQLIVSIVIKFIIDTKQKRRVDIKLINRTLLVASTPAFLIGELGMLLLNLNDKTLSFFRFTILVITILYYVFALKVIIGEEKTDECR